MIKRILIIGYILIGLVLFKFAFTYGYNEWVISKYEEENYDENFNLLEVANFNEPYIVYYNNGNVCYKRQDYERAIEYYETALAKDPPEGKECPVRINLALAKLALLDEDCMSKEKIEETIEILEECLAILSEEDCATDEGDGHNNRAQRLYDEIKEMLEQAQQEQQQQQQSDSQQESSDQSNSDNSDQSNSDNSDQSQSDNSDQSQSDSNQSQDPSDGSESDPSDGSQTESTMSDEEKRQSESLEQRQSEIEDEMEKRMSDSNDQRQKERKKSMAEGEDWNWDYDEYPVW